MGGIGFDGRISKKIVGWGGGGGYPPCTPTMENPAPLNICPRVRINISQFAICNTFNRTWNSGKLKNEQNYGTKNL